MQLSTEKYVVSATPDPDDRLLPPPLPPPPELLLLRSEPRRPRFSTSPSPAPPSLRSWSEPDLELTSEEGVRAPLGSDLQWEPEPEVEVEGPEERVEGRGLVWEGSCSRRGRNTGVRPSPPWRGVVTAAAIAAAEACLARVRGISGRCSWRGDGSCAATGARGGRGDSAGAVSLVLERYALSSCSDRGFVRSSELLHSELLTLPRCLGGGLSERCPRRGRSSGSCRELEAMESLSEALPFFELLEEYRSFRLPQERRKTQAELEKSAMF